MGLKYLTLAYNNVSCYKLLDKLNIEWDINEFLHYSDLENTLINRYSNYWFNNVNKETKRDGK